MMDQGEKKLNPWFSIWLQPRATIQQIVDSKPKWYVLLGLVAIAGTGVSLNKMSMRNVADHLATMGWQWQWVFLGAVVLGSLGGVFGLYVFTALLRWSGSRIGGKATQKNIRVAWAWASVPQIWSMLLWVPLLLMFGRENFSSSSPAMDESQVMVSVLGVLGIIVGVWGLIVLLKCIGQVQQFSAWKALGNIILASMLAFLVVIVPAGILVMFLSLLMS